MTWVSPHQTNPPPRLETQLWSWWETPNLDAIDEVSSLMLLILGIVNWYCYCKNLFLQYVKKEKNTLWVSFYFIILVTTSYYCLLSTIQYCYWWWWPWSWPGFWARSSWGDIQTNLWQVRPHQLTCQIQCHSLRLNGRFQGRSTPVCYFSHWFHDISMFHHLSPVLFNKMEQAALVMPNSVLCIQSLAAARIREHLRAILPYH